jgi:hypothetical protein
MRLGLLYAAVLCFVLAAISCGKGSGDTMGGSPYLQPFDIAFQGTAPPIAPGSAINDEFTNQTPLVGDPLAPFVGLDPKWASFNPGTNLGIRVVDQQRQMAYLAANGDKKWCGVYQPLPIPEIGQTLQYQLYMRNMIGFLPADDDYTGQLMGLLIGVDMAGAPATTDLWSLHSNTARVGTLVHTAMEAAAFATFDAPLVPDGAIDSSTEMEFLRARIRTTRSGPDPDDFDSEIHFEASQNGIGWVGVATYTAIDQQIGHVAAALRPSGNQFVVSYFDFLRFYSVPLVPGETLTTGGLQYLGAA